MHKKSASRSRNRAGFTMLELLIVMTIGAIVMMIAMPNINVTAMRVDSAGRQIDMALLGAQRLAVLRQYSIVVAFDTVNHQLRVHEDRNNNGAMDPGELLNYVKLEEGVRFGRSNGAPALPTVSSSRISFTKRQAGWPAVTFTREGAAGEAGGFYIASSRALSTSSFSKETKGFEINRGTGRTLMYSYSGTAWRRSF